MTFLQTVWRTFLAPFETMQHQAFAAPWSMRMRCIRLPSPRR